MIACSIPLLYRGGSSANWSSVINSARLVSSAPISPSGNVNCGSTRSESRSARCVAQTICAHLMHRPRIFETRLQEHKEISRESFWKLLCTTLPPLQLSAVHLYQHALYFRRVSIDHLLCELRNQACRTRDDSHPRRSLAATILGQQLQNAATSVALSRKLAIATSSSRLHGTKLNNVRLAGIAG